MRVNRCAARCGGCHGLGRREFLAAVSMSSASLLEGSFSVARGETAEKLQPQGPAAGCVPTIKTCFVRRKGDYGMRWPGAVYDGEAARKKYTQQIRDTAKQLNVKLDLRGEPIYSLEEADAWAAEAAKCRSLGCRRRSGGGEDVRENGSWRAIVRGRYCLGGDGDSGGGGRAGGASGRWAGQRL